MEKFTGSNFTVHIAPIELIGNFASVSGLNVEMDYEVYTEGGTFHPVYLTKGLKYDHIVLKRGTAPVEPLVMWFETVRTGMILRFPMVITMLNNSRIPVKMWLVLDTMPIRVEYGDLDAMSGQVALTTVELVHGEILPIML